MTIIYLACIVILLANVVVLNVLLRKAWAQNDRQYELVLELTQRIQEQQARSLYKNWDYE